MADTLYISDLDGTLLTPEGGISEQTARILNGLIDDGLLFSVATARSASSAIPILEPLRLRLPVILMNGAVVYDAAQKKSILDNGIMRSEKKSKFPMYHDLLTRGPHL